jgi:2-keto-3-deoxy-6-phosphogluconate aldolase
MCIGGSWITPSELQKKSDFDAIFRLATDAAHLGV